MTLLSPIIQASSIYLGGALLSGAGIYELTPSRRASLWLCRSPLEFGTLHWRQGSGGVFRMVLENGLSCLGCCWVLTALLSYSVDMNLWWIAELAVYILLEKFRPRQRTAGPIHRRVADRLSWIGAGRGRSERLVQSQE